MHVTVKPFCFDSTRQVSDTRRLLENKLNVLVELLPFEHNRVEIVLSGLAE